VISLGREKSAKLYVLLISSVYSWILIGIIIGIMPITMLITFVTTPLAVKAAMGVLRDSGDTERLIPTMGINVMLVLSTTGFASLGVLLSKFLI
jgi:1,4-dihydroxy-2-naphthoate octaprenyltransferase